MPRLVAAARPVRQWAPRLAIVLASGLVAAIVVSPAGAQSSERPFSWTGRAGAFALGVQFNTSPTLVPLEELVRGEFPQADSEWLGSGIARARAAPVYPGSSGTGGPGLTCEFGLPCSEIAEALGMPFPPAYPLVAEAQHPSRPDVTSADGLARARASRDGVSSTASLSDNDQLGALFDVLATLVRVGGAEASTNQEFVDGELVVTARSRVQDITLPGGVLHIGTVEAVSESRADGEAASTDASITVTGASLGGIPVSIDERGITVDETILGPVGSAAIDSALAFLADNLNLSIRTISIDTEDTEFGSRGHVAGLMIELDVPVSNPGIDLPTIPIPPEVPLPGDPNAFLVTYRTQLVLASAATLAHANDSQFGQPIDTPGPPAQPPAPGPGIAPPVEVPPPSSGELPVDGGNGQAPGPVVEPPQAAPPTVDENAVANLLAALGIDLEWSNLYPLVVLWALMLFVPFRLLRFIERQTRPRPMPPIIVQE